jgi:hypothetical protein
VILSLETHLCAYLPRKGAPADTYDAGPVLGTTFAGRPGASPDQVCETGRGIAPRIWWCAFCLLEPHPQRTLTVFALVGQLEPHPIPVPEAEHRKNSYIFWSEYIWHRSSSALPGGWG